MCDRVLSEHFLPARLPVGSDRVNRPGTQREKGRSKVADSKWPQDRDDAVPEPPGSDREVGEQAEPEHGEAPEPRGRDEPDRGTEPWQFWTQLAVEKGLPFLIQLWTLWNLAHGNGG